MQPTTTIQAAEPKPGIKTTEFWLSLIAMILGALLAAGAFPAAHWSAQVVGAIVTILGALGYNKGRAVVKAAASSSAPGIGTSPDADPR